MRQSKGTEARADNVRDDMKRISSSKRSSTRKHKTQGDGMAKSGTQTQEQNRAVPVSGQEDQALQLLRNFARDSRQTVKKPIRPQFGNRYVTPGSSD